MFLLILGRGPMRACSRKLKIDKKENKTIVNFIDIVENFEESEYCQGQSDQLSTTIVINDYCWKCCRAAQSFIVSNVVKLQVRSHVQKGPGETL